jgi:cytochrome P450
MVAANAYALHRREDFFPEPRKFIPERWLDRTPDKAAWIPFGGGKRHCLGRDFATYEIRYVIQKLLTRFEFATTTKVAEQTRRRAVAWIPADGARVTIRARSDA